MGYLPSHDFLSVVFSRNVLVFWVKVFFSYFLGLTSKSLPFRNYREL
jgi:hypothetical protein